jgi:hypothetical protein
MVSDDVGPGELDQIGTAAAVAEDPVVTPGLVEPAEIPLDDPVLRFPRIAVFGPGDLKMVRNLQKLMLRSRANALVSVRRVTERNAGRKTAGIDDVVIVTAPGKAALAERVHPPLRNDQSLRPAPTIHPARLSITRHQRRFTQYTRPVCPLPVTPGWSGNPSAFP